MAKTASSTSLAAAFLLLGAMPAALAWIPCPAAPSAATWQDEAKEQPKSPAVAGFTLHPQDKPPPRAIPIKPRVLDASFITFSPDGKFYVTAIAGGPPALYEAATHKEVRRFRSRTGWVDARFSPDGKTLAITGWCATSSFWLVDVATGKEVLALDKGPGALFELSPEGAFLASWRWWNKDRQIGFCNSQVVWGSFFWELSTGKELKEKHRVTPVCSGFAFSADGEYMLVEFNLLANEREREKNWHVFVPSWTTWFELWEVKSGARIADIGPPVEDQLLNPGGRLPTIGIHANGAFRVRVSSSGKALLLPFAKKERAGLGPGVSVRVIDTATGQELLGLADPEHRIWAWDATALSADSNTVAAIGHTGDRPPRKQLYIWHISRALDRARCRYHRCPQEWAMLWQDLGCTDLAKAYAACCALFATPDETCDFLAERMQPVPSVDVAWLKQLIADLDHDRYAVRDKAQKGLATVGELALPLLLERLKAAPLSEEQRVRATALIAKLKNQDIDPDTLRAVRAIELLEEFNSLKSMQLLSAIAKGERLAWVTLEADASLKRLNKRK